MRRSFLALAVLLVAGPAQAAQPDYAAQLNWSTATQDNNGGAWCEGISTTFGYDGRHDLTLPAHGGSPAVPLVLSPEVQDLPSWSYNDNDGEDVVNIGINMDRRAIALVGLMALHERCTMGAAAAQDGCISLGQVERVMDILFRNANTGADFTPDTYDAPRQQVLEGTQYVWRFSEPRHVFNWHPGGGTTTMRHRTFQGIANGSDRYKWDTLYTPGAFVPCVECMQSGSGATFNPGKQGDHVTWSPTQIAAAEAEILAGPAEGEYALDQDGKVFVPFCPEAQ